MSYIEKRKRNKLWEKLLTQRQKESSTSIKYRNQICRLMLQLWKIPRKIPRHKPVRVKYSHRPVNKSVNSGSSIDNRSSLSKLTSASSSGISAQKPAASTNTKLVAAKISTRVERNPRSPKKGNQNSEATGCQGGQMIRSHFTKNLLCTSHNKD